MKTISFTLTSDQIGDLRVLLNTLDQEANPIVKEILTQYPKACKIQLIKGFRDVAIRQGLNLSLKQAKELADELMPSNINSN